jgi:oxidase EvaA
MAERAHLDWFRGRLAASAAIEPKDPAPILAWREERCRAITFKAELIGLEGVRVESGALREVTSWDQPIYTQPEGGVLGLLSRETPDHGVQFLLYAKAEPGNIGVLQLAPSVQSTWSNIRRAHGGKLSPMLEVLTATSGVRTIYRAEHNEEGGRFWRKSNENIIVFVEDEGVIQSDMAMFYWASLSQIRELATIDNVLSPFVKTIIAPL